MATACDTECSKSDVIEAIHANTTLILHALYGKPGALNGEGIGLVARQKDQDVRISRLEDSNKQRGNTMREFLMRMIPYGVMLFSLALTGWISLRK